jgi:hypothetical protein
MVRKWDLDLQSIQRSENGEVQQKNKKVRQAVQRTVIKTCPTPRNGLLTSNWYRMGMPTTVSLVHRLVDCRFVKIAGEHKITPKSPQSQPRLEYSPYPSKIDKPSIATSCKTIYLRFPQRSWSETEGM